MVFDKYEQGIIFNIVDESRKKLITGGEYADAADELIVKFINTNEEIQNQKNGVFSLWKRQYLSRWVIYTLQSDYYLPNLRYQLKNTSSSGPYRGRGINVICKNINCYLYYSSCKCYPVYRR